MKIIKISVIFILLNIYSNILNAQGTIINHELGVFIGPTFMQTDYGEAENFQSSINNTGFGFGIAYIADFSNSRPNTNFGRFFSQHVKLRGELSHIKASFAFDGKPVNNPSAEQDRFKAMQGNSKMLNFGLFTEIYPFRLINDKKLQPYFLLGGSYTSANPSLKSSLPLPSIFLPEEDNVFMEKHHIFSYTTGLGLRYQLDEVDLVFEYKLNYFTSDKVEGLSATFSGNKNNDAQTIFNLGVIFNVN